MSQDINANCRRYSR